MELQFNFNTAVKSATVSADLQHDLYIVGTFGFLHWVARFKPSAKRRLRIREIQNNNLKQ